MMSTEDIKRLALARHKLLRGKLEVRAKDRLDSRKKLNIYYTPGVAAVSSHLAKNPQAAASYTIKANTIAVVSDGSAVLGLGNIGPLGALPVMEGKAMIFKEFAGLDAFPIVLSTQDPDEIVETVVRIAPTFGGINLEDIAAPKCFDIERRVQAAVDIPVMHDDQHGTAIVVLAGLINALKVVKKSSRDLRVVLLGAGAAGTAISKLLLKYDRTIEVTAVDSRGIISKSRKDLNAEKQLLLALTNPSNRDGDIADAIASSDVLIGVSSAGIVNRNHVRSMSKDPIIFAMANPDPEILPKDARAAGAAVIATGRSDFPNQLNNALVFPGFFRGALDHKVRKITDKQKLAAAQQLAKLIKRPTADLIIPSALDRRVVPAIARAIV